MCQTNVRTNVGLHARTYARLEPEQIKYIRTHVGTLVPWMSEQVSEYMQKHMP